MKKVLIIGGGSTLLLLAILFGAFFAGPLLASANNTATTSGASTKQQYCSQYQQDLAKRLGISESQLQQNNQAALADVLAQMVKDGKLTQARADKIKQRVASHPNCAGLVGLGKGLTVKQLVNKYHTDFITQVAQGLNMKSDDLTSQLQAGKSLMDIAATKNVSTDQLRTIATNAINSILKKAVSDHNLTQAQADHITQSMQKNPQALNRLLNAHKRTKNK
jgi:predicted transcriptional regulator